MEELLEAAPQVLSLQLQLSFSGLEPLQQFQQAWHAMAPATAVQSMQLVFQGLQRLNLVESAPEEYVEPERKVSCPFRCGSPAKLHSRHGFSGLHEAGQVCV